VIKKATKGLLEKGSIGKGEVQKKESPFKERKNSGEAAKRREKR